MLRRQEARNSEESENEQSSRIEVPDASQCISCRRRAGYCCNGKAVAHPRLGPGGGRPSSRRGTPKRQWLLSLQDRRLPGNRDLGWLWADSDLADLRHERL